MDLGLKAKVALVGGASSGLGLAIARELAAEGVRVALLARREDGAAAAGPARSSPPAAARSPSRPT